MVENFSTLFQISKGRVNIIKLYSLPFVPEYKSAYSVCIYELICIVIVVTVLAVFKLTTHVSTVYQIQMPLHLVNQIFVILEQSIFF